MLYFPLILWKYNCSDNVSLLFIQQWQWNSLKRTLLRYAAVKYILKLNNLFPFYYLLGEWIAFQCSLVKYENSVSHRTYMYQ